MARILGLDIGTKTVGVAISDVLGIIASALEVIKYDGDINVPIAKLEKIINEKEVETIVIGLPLHMNGDMSQTASLVLKFKDYFEKNSSVKVILIDERLTTVSATNSLIDADMSRKKRKAVIDKVAAQIILARYLDTKRG